MKPPRTRCDRCGRTIAKARAVIDGQAYCAACHKRLCRPTTCRGCGAATRVPPDAVPLCRACRYGARQCHACGRPIRKAARVTPQGRLCAACVARARPEGRCAYCGAISRYLARSARLGLSQPACPRCQRADHITCPACGKNRRPAGCDLTTRQQLCRGCLNRLGKPFVCPACGREGRRHSGRRCELCYWRATGRARAETLATALSGWAGELFPRFAEELLARHPDPRQSTLRLPRYAAFFAEVEGAFPDPRAADAAALLKAFPPERLRRYRPAADYLGRNLLPALPGAALRAEHIHARQQQHLLAGVRDHWGEAVLAQYHQWLQLIAARHRAAGWTGVRARFVPKTVTVNLRAAAGFLTALPAGITSARQLTQADLDSYLTCHPGQVNPLRAFVTFLNERRIPFRRLAVARGAWPLPYPLPFLHYLELRVRLLAEGRLQPKPTLAILLALTFGLSLRRIVRLPLGSLRLEAEGGTLRLTAVDVALPEDLAGLARDYLAQRKALAVFDDADLNPYLFPGRTAGDHLDEATAGFYFKRYGLTSAQAVATFWSNAFRLGQLQNPKVLVDALGHHPARAIAYFQRFTGPPTR